jgi:sodium/bile acid cotransporter 7
LKIKIDNFIIGIILAIIIAYFSSFFGDIQNTINLNLIAQIGVVFIFFFYGLKLDLNTIGKDLQSWKLHLIVQCTTFIVFPLLVLAFYPFIQSKEIFNTWIAFLYLAALPSTVSTSVVFVSIAKGNIVAAILNASISGLIGILITPLWIGLFLNKTTENFDLSSIYLKLITEILLPVFVGILVQKLFTQKSENFVSSYAIWIKTFDKSVVVLIIFKTFQHSFSKNLFSSISLTDLGIIFILSVLLFFTIYYFTKFVAQKLQFNNQDSIVLQFCGTKKSMIHGTIFSKIIFPANFSIGIILLPLMVFHTFQMIMISYFAQKYSKINTQNK